MAYVARQHRPPPKVSRGGTALGLADISLSFVGAAMAGLGLGALGLVLTTQPDLPGRVDLSNSAPRPAQTADNPAISWPPLFGAEPPPAKVEPATQPPEPSPDYTLKGVVAYGKRGWAIVAFPDGDQLVNFGSVLPDGATVVAIEPDGVVIERDGKRYVIGFAKGDAVVAAGSDQPAPPSLLHRSTLSLSELRQGDFRRMLGLAGGSRIVDMGDGALAQQIVWVRNGRLYDRIGLRNGDTILTINGVPAGDMDALMAAVPKLLRQRQFELVLIRAGARLTVEVVIDEDS